MKVYAWLWSVLLLVPVAAQESAPEATTQETEVGSGTFPFEGEVATDRLNVRMLPSKAEQSTISAILSAGDKVTVVGEENGYYQIFPTTGCAVWVYGRNLKVEGNTATVLSDSTPVRVDSRNDAREVGKLQTGDTVTVLRSNMGWYRIEAPTSVPYYVWGKYVRRVRDLDPSVVGVAAVPGLKATAKTETTPDSDAEARAKFLEGERLVEGQRELLNERRVKELDYTAAIASFEASRELAKSEGLRSQAETSVKLYKELQQKLDWVKAQVVAFEELRRSESDAAGTVAAQKTYAFTGYIETAGLMWNRPAAFQLMNGGKRIAFLKPAEGDEAAIQALRRNYKVFVGVNGTIVNNPEGWPGETVVIIGEITPIQLAK